MTTNRTILPPTATWYRSSHGRCCHYSPSRCWKGVKVKENGVRIRVTEEDRTRIPSWSDDPSFVAVAPCATDFGAEGRGLPSHLLMVRRARDLGVSRRHLSEASRTRYWQRPRPHRRAHHGVNRNHPHRRCRQGPAPFSTIVLTPCLSSPAPHRPAVPRSRRSSVPRSRHRR